MNESWDLHLHGGNVALRALQITDAQSLAEAAAENRQHYLYNPVPDGLEAAREYIERALRQRLLGQRIPFAVVLRDRLVGTTSFGDLVTWQWPLNSPLQRLDSPDVVEIGYTWLAHSAQRTECNTQAKRLLLCHAFEVWQVHRVSFRTDERNLRSRHALERLGARFEGIRRADMPSVDGRVRNSAYYSIIQAEWPEIHRHLQQLLSNR